VDLEGVGMIDQPAGGIGEIPFASMGDLGLDRRKVTQCALSRICGVCGNSLGRPVAFLGSAEEADANAFHFPPTHVECADTALELWGDTTAALGFPAAPESWAVVTTSGFEYIRPNKETEDRRAVFAPNSRIDDRRVPAAAAHP
jgi:hypothetical protein